MPDLSTTLTPPATVEAAASAALNSFTETTQAGNASADGAPVTQTDQLQVAPAPAPRTLVESLKDLFTIPDDVDDNQLKEQISGWFDRSQQIQDGEDLNQMRQAVAQYQQLAPEISEFQKWKQERATAQSSAQAQAEQARIAAEQAKWQIPELTSTEQSLVKIGETGRFVPIDQDPMSIAAAQKANHRQLARQQLADRFLTNPQGFVDEAAQPVIKRLQEEHAKELAEIKAMLQQQQQYQAQSQEQAEFNAFVQQNHDLLTAPDPANPANRVWSQAAEVFSNKFDQLVQRGLDAATAREFALDFAKLSQPQASAPVIQQAAPQTIQRNQQRPADPKTAAARAIDIAKQRQPNVASGTPLPAGSARTLSQLAKMRAQEWDSQYGNSGS